MNSCLQFAHGNANTNIKAATGVADNDIAVIIGGSNDIGAPQDDIEIYTGKESAKMYLKKSYYCLD